MHELLRHRAAGVLLHPTSLPPAAGDAASPGGDLGAAAHAFVDWLAQAGLSLWQMLPLVPPGPGESPYQSPSAMAGSAALVALAPLVERGWLGASALEGAPAGPGAWRVDLHRSARWRADRLAQAAAGFAARAQPAEREALAAWRQRQAHWLPDWTLYAALKAAHGGRPWWQWPPALGAREPGALAAAARALAAERDAEAFVQWQFDEQAAALRAHARRRGVALLGDLPIFVAHDSADVWAQRSLFRLGDDGQPAVVAGVPPDGYSPDGQRWGNPLYDWERMAADGFAWWIARLARALALADGVRIDHFRGFAACWEIPGDSPTARRGRWVPVPGQALFDAAVRVLGPLPVVAEDLGLITPDVDALRERYGWPGMRIVYEGLMHGPSHPFCPHHHVPGALACSSTHDSDTAAGWWRTAGAAQRAFAGAYLRLPADAAPPDAAAAVVQATWQSVARLALAPAQDLLGLDDAHRMNRPGTAEGNWSWRAAPGVFDAALAARVRTLTAHAGRLSAREAMETAGPVSLPGILSGTCA